jgi:hypothetical protein
MGDEDKQEAMMTISEVRELLDDQRTEAHNNIIAFADKIKPFVSKQVISAFGRAASIAHRTKVME